MITSIQFKNFRVLRDATLPLGPFTLIIGPNGSGKSTAMQGIAFAKGEMSLGTNYISWSSTPLSKGDDIQIKTTWDIDGVDALSIALWEVRSDLMILPKAFRLEYFGDNLPREEVFGKVRMLLNGFGIFSFDANSIATATRLVPRIELASDGANLAGVLDNLRDMEPERFEALNAELGRWLPEFDRILFETPEPGFRAFLLRTRNGRHKIRAADLSQGTLLALAFLTLAYLPSPPPIVCFEEPERGIHPRLLREIQDSMYRLAYPESYSEQRQPVQVIATTHSPYLLDLYKDHPEEIVIAQKDEGGARFERLSDKPNIDEFLQDASLGDVWYSGVLGGVPNTP